MCVCVCLENRLYIHLDSQKYSYVHMYSMCIFVCDKVMRDIANMYAHIYIYRYMCIYIYIYI